MAKAIKNLGRLFRKLDALGGNAQPALNRSTKQVTTKAAADARRMAPVNKNPQSESDGSAALHNNISENFTQEGAATVGHVVVASDHGAYVEFGTGQRGAASPSPPKWDGPLSYREDWAGMAAQPYLYPASVQNREVYVDAASAELEKAIAAAKGVK